MAEGPVPASPTPVKTRAITSCQNCAARPQITVMIENRPIEMAMMLRRL